MKKTLIILGAVATVVVAAAITVLVLTGKTGKSPDREITQSGLYDTEKLSAEALRKLYGSLTGTDSLYAKEPDLSKDGYSPSVLTEDAYLYIEQLINYYRIAAGVEEISLKDDLNESASWGALTMAMGRDFSHEPEKPEAMSQKDYEKGSYATACSNISYYSTNAENVSIRGILENIVEGQMNDSDSKNIARVGHRRWLLYPPTLTMGLGVTDTETDYHDYYSVIRVSGNGVDVRSAADYDFISWPASGYNLSDTFSPQDPWSVSLNSDKFRIPDADKVQVFLIREEDGRSWRFNCRTDISEPGSKDNYFAVETGNYGLDNAIIFRPAYEKIEKYEGSYRVLVTGLYDKEGRKHLLNYEVTFIPYNENESRPEG